MSGDRDGTERGIDRQEPECRAFDEDHLGVVPNISSGNDKGAMSGKAGPRLGCLLRDDVSGAPAGARATGGATSCGTT